MRLVKLPNIFAGSNRTLVAANTISQFVGKVISAAATFCITIFIARSFGVNGFGDFTKITSYVALFYLLADFGLNAIYLQKTQKESSENWWAALVWLRLLGSILLVFIAISLLAFIPQGQGTGQGYTTIVRLGIILFAPAILFQAIITTTNAVFQKQLRYDLSAIAGTVGSIVSVIFVWFVTITISQNLGSVFSALALLVGTSVTSVVALIFIRHREQEISLLVNFNTLKTLFVLALPLGLTLLFNQVYFRVDSFILALTRATSEVGIYGLAYKVFEVTLVAPTFFMNAVYPVMLKNMSDTRIIKKSFFVLLPASFVAIIILWIGAPLLTLVRPEFAASIVVLRILSLGFPFFFLSALTMWALIAYKKQTLLVFIYGFTAIVTTTLDILFIPSMGYIAAAWITVFSEALILGISGFILLKLV